MCNNPILGLVNFNAYVKFGHVPSTRSQDIDRKRNSDINQGTSRVGLYTENSQNARYSLDGYIFEDFFNIKKFWDGLPVFRK